MNTTGNYNLKKPEGTDLVDVQDFNDNADIIDAELAKKANKDVATTSANGLMSASDKVKLNGISANANNYTHPTTAGNKHIPAGGSSGQILRWSADALLFGVLIVIQHIPQ